MFRPLQGNRHEGCIHRNTDAANSVKDAHVLRQNLLYFYSFIYNLPENGFVEAETYWREIVNDKR